MYDIKYLHQFLKDSSVPMEAKLPISNTVPHTFKQNSNPIIPSAMTAMGSHQGTDRERPTPTQYRNGNNNRYKNNYNKPFH